MTAKDYQAAAQKAIPPSKSYKNIPMAFLVGGLLCVLGQAVINLALSFGLEKDMASACGSISLILLSAVLTGLNVYDTLPSTPVQVPSYPSQALPIPWYRPLWNSKAKATFWDWALKCSPSQGPCWFMAFPHR